MAKPDLGGKRQCQSCGTKFFDLNHDPIICPKCGTVFQAVAARAAPARRAEADDEAEPDTANVELVSLEDADAAEAKAVGASDDDIEIEDDDNAGDDETFLEEEEEDNDDVSGLIDGDIETDEES
ncbi:MULTISPECIES: TIGR02300 family protein [unclassified Beijerinckia]|uniref:TIGR02300 family protein n=1 Tax=unclassified Beijerinckia TaxID=2638183 RepID=UPI0008998782|nr:MULTISPECIES: TIGR02300 family protein [unclassified Beijerinckia]MDH7797850.1 uncharacterized protein (TIGR02300 family) [Beijerinckia sp. GAS462]SED00628.1 TIGR02300 family protein [Beijerinckia sp. 28-YEA-48]